MPSTYIGQLAILRRLSGAPIKGENYYMAEIAAGRTGPDQSRSRAANSIRPTRRFGLCRRLTLSCTSACLSAANEPLSVAATHPRLPTEPLPSVSSPRSLISSSSRSPLSPSSRSSPAACAPPPHPSGSHCNHGLIVVRFQPLGGRSHREEDGAHDAISGFPGVGTDDPLRAAPHQNPRCHY